ncbi:HlyD family efflux transporter periplasmic adaptor subunit [Ruminococcus sp.]|uniref:HlyD family efflux transporter periplasmic adaptor subunit n=1 Tax=Ruminococcus sp. TaxID=41978 RepID=UPI002D12394C|nr:HlyD family efflux transporter periplasmic adaptor subunit [Ruminococcus sp.]HNZ99959.1 HlyD family efflux transporter periplasmic adaptor subunit [Ruminococcus sp.]HOH86393.1 HlyD family efflux transporter periplasmic adaptor subunit [Ruminococcus sp.]
MRFTKSEGSFLVKTLRNVVLVLLLIIFVSIVYNFRNRESNTVSALTASAVSSKEYKGVFIRDEEILLYSGNGVLSYNVSDGGKVGSDTIIAEAYPDDEQLSIKREKAKLENELNILKKIQNPGTLESAQPASLSESIDTSYRSLIYYRDTGDYDELEKVKDDLLVQLSTYQIITNEVQDFNQKISDIEAEITKLDARSVVSKEQIQAPRSAYFASYCDGYEDKLTTAGLDKITASEIDSIEDKKSTAPNVVGKLIDGYGWYLALVADNSRKEYAIGENVRLRFDSSAESYPAQITDIRDESSTRSVIIIFCDKFNCELVQHRAERVELIKGEFTGLKVPREAIRFKDITETVTDDQGNEQTKNSTWKGVYIREGEQILFKKIDVIYEGSDYVLSKITDDTEFLALYDDIIIEEVDKDDEQ